MARFPTCSAVNLAIVVAISLFVFGCSFDDSNTNPTPGITDDLFPLVVGHKINFTGFLRQPGADTNLTSTRFFYQSRWTVGTFKAAVDPVGSVGSATAIVDSVKIGPNAIDWRVDTLLVQKAVASGAVDFSFLTSIASFYRTYYPAANTSGTSRTDSLRWMQLTQLTPGMGVEFTAYDSTYNIILSGQSTTARLLIAGIFNGTETWTLAGQTFTTYKLTISRKVYLNSSSTPVSPVQQTAVFWIAANVGPIRMILNADDRNYGNFKEYSGKNF